MDLSVWSDIVLFLESSKYALLFIGSFVEGAVVMMVGGFLWHQGEVAFWPMFLALFLGDILSDTGWYLLGYWGARPLVVRWGGYVGIVPQTVAKIERYFTKYHLWILVISKLTMGFGLGAATLVVAGMSRIPFGRFAVIVGSCSVIWVGAMVMAGYYFGNVFDLIQAEFKTAFVVASLGAAVLVMHFVTKAFKRMEL